MTRPKDSPDPSLIPLVIMDDTDSHTFVDDAILRRREMVSKLRARKLTTREIVLALATNFPTLNDGGPPIQTSRTQVERDLEFLREQWMLSAARSMREWMADELADLEQMEAFAWKKGDMGTLARIKERKHKLLGIDKPNPLANLVIPWDKLTEQQVQAILDGKDVFQVLQLVSGVTVDGESKDVPEQTVEESEPVTSPEAEVDVE